MDLADEALGHELEGEHAYSDGARNLFAATRPLDRYGLSHTTALDWRRPSEWSAPRGLARLLPVAARTDYEWVDPIFLTGLGSAPVDQVRATNDRRIEDWGLRVAHPATCTVWEIHVTPSVSYRHAVDKTIRGENLTWTQRTRFGVNANWGEFNYSNLAATVLVTPEAGGTAIDLGAVTEKNFERSDDGATLKFSLALPRTLAPGRYRLSLTLDTTTPALAATNPYAPWDFGLFLDPEAPRPGREVRFRIRRQSSFAADFRETARGGAPERIVSISIQNPSRAVIATVTEGTLASDNFLTLP